MAVPSGITGKQHRRIMNMVIDFHTHPIPEAFRQALSDMNIDPIEDDGFPLPEWTVDAHLNFMAQAGIDYSVLSLPSPHFITPAIK